MLRLRQADTRAAADAAIHEIVDPAAELRVKEAHSLLEPLMFVPEGRVVCVWVVRTSG